jgi:peptidoglycan/LPS O-acetylase OafA/YrhL
MTTAVPSIDSTASREGATHRLAGIDGLRALAVILVIAFHSFPKLVPAGFIGVDVFFAISGYVVCGSLYRHREPRIKGFLQKFYWRRLVRIYPCLLVTGILSALFIPEAYLSEPNIKVGLAAVFGLSNIAQVFLSNAYFAATTDYNPYIHTWSLGVEEQFYLIFPLLLFLWTTSRTGPKARFVKALFPILIGASLIASAVQTHTNPLASYYMLYNRFWELGFGAALYIAQNSSRFRGINRPAFATPSVLAGLLIVLFSAWMAVEAQFPFPWALPPVMGSLLIIYGVSVNESKAGVVLWAFENRASAYVGRISYSLYLWHWPILSLFRWTVGLGRTENIIVALILIVMFSLVSYHIIEVPARKLNRLVLAPAKPLALGIAVIFAAGLCLGFTGIVRRRISLSVTKSPLWYGKTDLKSMIKQPLNGASRAPLVYLLGDSHAAAIRPMLKMFSDKENATVVVDSEGGESFIGLIQPDTQTPESQKRWDKMLGTLKRGDVVFLESLRMPRLCEEWDTFPIDQVVSAEHSSQAAVLRQAALQESFSFVGELQKRGVWVVFDAPEPVLPTPPFRCSDWFNRHNPVCSKGFTVSKALLKNLGMDVMASLTTLRSKYSNVVVWDVFPLICPGSECSAFDDVGPLFTDGDHYSVHGNQRLLGSFDETVSKLLKAPPKQS